jgi:hypothetical protein
LIIVGNGQLGKGLENKDLTEVVSNLQQQAAANLQGQEAATHSLKTSKTIRRLHRKDESIDQSGICQGIAETVRDFCDQLTLDTEPPLRGWQKLRLAQACCDINLEEKHKRKDPLTDEQLKVLTKAVQQVSQFYLTAIFLWRVGKQRNFNKDRLTLVSQGDLKKCMNYLNINFRPLEIRRLREPKDFFELDRNIQVTYLKAAMLAPSTLSPSTALLMHETLTANVDVLPYEESSNLRHQILDGRTVDPGELKRNDSQEFGPRERPHHQRSESQNLGLRVQEPRRPKNISTDSIAEDPPESHHFLAGNDSPD